MVDPVVIDGPVGLRWRKQNVQNNAVDQGRIIGLLAKIPKTQGGKQEEWVTPPLTGGDKQCPGFVADAIWDFQEFWKAKGHFKNIDGVVDPKMNTLAQLNVLAGGGKVPPTPPPGPLTPFIVPLKQNPLFTLNGTTAVARTPPLHPGDWVRRTQATFDTLCANPLGRALVMGRRAKVLVEPFPTADVNAGTIPSPEDGEVVRFTTDNFDGQTDAGTLADEMLFHELIHVTENHYGLYDDIAENPLKYHRSDFMTITATNVYASSKGRVLRAHHVDYSSMPSRYVVNPGEHVAVWRGNYQRAYNNNRALFTLLKNQPAAWNPFKLYTP